MKTCFIPLLVLLVATTSADAQERSGSDPAAEKAAYTVAERGAHHKVWERIESELGPDGKPFPRKRSYTELATGMHFKNERGEWEDAREEIEILPDNAGAIARKGQHKAIFPPEIKTGLFELQTPDGQWLRSRVWGLAYFDASTGESVLLAEVKESEGQLVGDNVVVYPDAFTDFRADIRLTYFLAGFEQDVVLKECPPTPQELGLNPKTTRLQVLTEFVETATPTKTRQQVGELSDDTLGFSGMTIGLGKAFSVNTAGDRTGDAPVAKQWERLESRDFLIEAVPYEKVSDQLQKLPAAGKYEGASLQRRGKGESTLASLKPLMPKRYAKTSPSPKDKSKRMAKTSYDPASGFVMDYIITLTSQPNYTLKGDTTYHVSSAVALSGTTTIEGGAVIKYDNSAAASLTVSGPLVCKTDGYRPAVFTSKNDNSVGETVSGSTGNPISLPFYSTALKLTGTYNSHTLENLRFGYFNVGVQFEGSYGSALTLRHLQFKICGTAVKCTSITSAPLYAGNLLLADVTTGFESAYGVYAQIENVTAHQVYSFANFVNTSYSSLAVKNGIFVNVSTVANSGLPTTGEINAFYNTASFGTAPISLTANPFQTVGGGAYYLAENSPCRNAGTANLNVSLLPALRKKTTFPPIAFTKVTFAVPTTLNPQAQRDTDTPDLGYHYDPLDYSLGGCTASANLTFTAGTVVGWFRTTSGWYHAGQGIRMQGNITVAFDGTVAAPTYFVRLNTVQEDDRTAGYGHGGIENWEGPAFPTVRGWFLRCSALAGENFNGYFADDFGGIRAEMTHTEFWAGALQTYGDYMLYTNCLMWRPAFVGVVIGQAQSSFVMRNCTMIGGRLEMQRSGPTPVLIRDCSFDGTTISLADSYGSNPDYTDCNYNAYTHASNPFPVGGDQDLPSVNFNWQAGPLGKFYLPTASPLLNGGSVNAPAIRLYHYTTQVSQTEETISQVDIGYHYVAVGVGSTGLVGYWPLDETTGTVAGDSSESGHIGTLFNGPTWTTGQAGTGALNFDGADDYVSVANSSTLATVGQSGADFTVSYWLRLQAGFTGSWRNIMHKGATDSQRTFAMWMNPSNNKIHYRISTTSSWNEGADSVGQVPVNQWVHVTYAKVGNKLRLYFNGVMDSEVTLAGASVANSGPLYLGKDPWYNGTNCRLDDVRVYTRVLTISEIIALANQSRAPDDNDGDGAPDYLEDTNGDGSVTGDPTSWQTYNSPNQLTVGNGLRVFTPLK